MAFFYNYHDSTRIIQLYEVNIQRIISGLRAAESMIFIDFVPYIL